MLVRAYNPNDFSTDGQWVDWGAPYINYAGKMGWHGAIITPPPSKVTDSYSDVTETRMYIAKLITNANGRNYNFDDSIQFLLDTALSAGKMDKTIDGYKKNDTLTRAEAVTFIKNGLKIGF